MAGARLPDPDHEPAVEGRQAVELVPDSDPLGHLARPQVEPDERAVELVAHPDTVAIRGQSGGPVADRRHRGDRVRLGIDARHGPVEAVRHPDAAARERDPGRAVPDRDRLEVAGRRIDARDVVRGGVGCPDRSVADRELGRRDVDRLQRPIGGHIDLRHGVVACVGDPDRAVRMDDPVRGVADADGVDDAIHLGIDPGDGPGQAVRDPDRAVAERDPGRPASDGDRLTNRVCLGVDPVDGVVGGVAHPDGAHAPGYGRRRRADRDVGHDAARVRLDEADRAADRRGDRRRILGAAGGGEEHAGDGGQPDHEARARRESEHRAPAPREAPRTLGAHADRIGRRSRPWGDGRSREGGRRRLEQLAVDGFGLGRGVGPELVGEEAPAALVHAECLGRVAGGDVRLHQRAVARLAEGLEVGDLGRISDCVPELPLGKRRIA